MTFFYVPYHKLQIPSYSFGVDWWWRRRFRIFYIHGILIFPYGWNRFVITIVLIYLLVCPSRRIGLLVSMGSGFWQRLSLVISSQNCSYWISLVSELWTAFFFEVFKITFRRRVIVKFQSSYFTCEKNWTFSFYRE